jgi:hypothetical protein
MLESQDALKWIARVVREWDVGSGPMAIVGQVF